MTILLSEKKLALISVPRRLPFAAMTGIVAETNQEPWGLEESNEDGEERAYWVIQNCPASKSCNTWKRARAWSFESEEKVRAYAKHHIIASSSHDFSDEQVDKMINGCTVDCYMQTADDRHASRLHMKKTSEGARMKDHRIGEKRSGDTFEAAQSEQARKRNDYAARPYGFGAYGRGASSPAGPSTSAIVKEVVAQVVGELACKPSALSLGDGSATAPAASTLSTSSITIPLSRAQLLYDSLNRASYAAKQSAELCAKLHIQFNDEAKVLHSAKDIIK